MLIWVLNYILECIKPNYYFKAASMDKKSNYKSEPNGLAMSKAMEMFNGQGRGAELSSAKDTAYGLLCGIC
ncbi:Mycobacteriophage Barnyard protein gp56 [Acinetobacter pittii]|nr:Mycobacteriophage Barnyard protein gp56 [Acinetobacter pittii]